jgi:selenocysteine lyase/cysteine desulfurase
MTRDLALDLERLRADTPGTANVVHLNNAGSALPPAVVVDTVVAHLRREAEIGGYEAHAEARDRVEAARTSVGRLVGAAPEHIAFAESATVGWSRAFAALAHSGVLVPGARILTTQAEYASNVIAMLQAARHRGVSVEAVPDTAEGSVDVDALAAMVDERVVLLALTWAPSQNGVLHDAAGAGRALRAGAPEAWYLVDGCGRGAAAHRRRRRRRTSSPRPAASSRAARAAQTSMPARGRSRRWSRSRSTCTVRNGRRSRATPWPRGPPLRVLGDLLRRDPRPRAAADYALDLGLDAIAAAAGDRGHDPGRLSEVPGVVVRDRGPHRGAIVTFTVDDVPAADVAAALTAAGVNVSVSTPEYALRDFLAHGVRAAVRVSPHVYTSDAEVDALIGVVARASVR